MTPTPYVLDFSEISLADVPKVGGKNASLGEMFRALKPKRVGVLDGFATTADAYRHLLGTKGLEERLRTIFGPFDPENLVELARRGEAARAAVLDTPIPDDLRTAILGAYDRLSARLGREPELAVRSSATAEDLPEASFAGAAETFLNVRGREGLLRAVQACYSSLFTDRAISYRARLGYDQLKVALSVGVMPMVRSDKASSGVIFTLDTESGFRDVVTVSGVLRSGRVRRPGRRHAGRMDGVQADARDRSPRDHRPAARHERSPTRVRGREQSARAASRRRSQNARGSA